MRKLPELEALQKLFETDDPLIQKMNLGNVEVDGKTFPLLALIIGSQDKTKPCLGLFGGVHGLERIGSHVILAYLTGLLSQLKWDQNLRKRFENSRIAVFPIVNPGGMYMLSRSNPQGVDLMRNAPVESLSPSHSMISGHRISNKLPWYRGAKGANMELESQALVDFVTNEILTSTSSICLDVHSGFGVHDQLWYPYAKSRDDFPKMKEIVGLKKLLNESLPYHVYKIEPQSLNYTTHGDLWDHLFERHIENAAYNKNLFLPWTLELGSWLWLRKNPTQIMSALGLFNPMKKHRYNRIMRRHILLIDFLWRATENKSSWA